MLFMSDRWQRKEAEAYEKEERRRKTEKLMMYEAEQAIRTRLKGEFEKLERAEADFEIVKDAAKFAIAALKDTGNEALAKAYEEKLRNILELHLSGRVL